MWNKLERGDTEPIQVYAVNSMAVPLTGKADLFVRVYRNSDGQYLDWNDSTFKASAWTTLNQVLAEVDATNAPGLYEVTGGLDTSALTNGIDDTYTVISLQTPGTDARLPSPAQLNVEKFAAQVFVDNYVLADSTNGTSGTAWPLGTVGNPTDSIADARTIALANGMRRISVQGAMGESLAADYSFWNITGDNTQNNTIDINGQTVTGAVFKNLNLRGTSVVTIAAFMAEDCQLGTPPLAGVTFNGLAYRCSLTGTVTIGPFGMFGIDCTGIFDDSHANTAVLSCSGAFRFTRLSRWTGPITITNLDASSSFVDLYVTGGKVIVDSSCTAGNVRIRGICEVVDNNGGATVTDLSLSSRLSGDHWSDAEREQIRDALGVDGDKTTADGGQLQFLFDDAGGKWEVDTVNNQMKIYKADNSTLIATYDLFDSSGNPTSLPANITRRDRV